MTDEYKNYAAEAYGEFLAVPFQTKEMRQPVGWRITCNWIPAYEWDEIVATRKDAIRTMRVLTDEYSYTRSEK